MTKSALFWRWSAGWLIVASITFAASCSTGAERTQERIRFGTVYEGKLFSVVLPRPNNPFVQEYRIRVLPPHDPLYEKVEFAVPDFGQYIVIGSRTLPGQSLEMMQKDSPEVVLQNLAGVILGSWRSNFPSDPEVHSDRFFDSKHGRALFRTYRAIGGGMLSTRSGGNPPSPPVRVDAFIAVIVARQGPQLVFLVAENDYTPDNRSVELMAQETLDNLVSKKLKQ